MKNILIVEDSKSIARMLEVKLKTKYLDSTIAPTMQKAKDLVEEEENKFFAAILDLNLPDAPNGEIVDYILSKNIPSIVLSGNFNDDLYELITNKNVIDFVIKNREEDIDYVVKVIDNISRYRYKKALIVDDSTLSREIIKMHLELLLFNVYEAKDGEEALKILNEMSDINLIVTDYHMPVMDGFELTLQIRKKYKKFQKVVIGETAHGSKDVSAKFLKYGANGYITKPFTKEEFNYTIHNAMDYVQQINKIEEQLDLIDKNINCSKTDIYGNIIYVSEAFLKESGYTKSELIGKSHSILRHPDIPSEFYKKLWSKIKGGDIWSGEIKNRKKDGSSYWVEVQIEPIFNKNGEVIAFNAIRRDITSQKDKERQEKILIQQAKMSAMGEMLSLVSHHWRQPLSRVSLILDSIEDSLEDDNLDREDIKNSIEYVMAQVQDMSKTISYFTNYFKSDKRKDILNLNKTIEEILDIMKPSFEEMKVKFNILIDSNYEIKIFKNEFTQAVINILKNSLEAFRTQSIKEPKIKISAYTVEENIHTIEIIDNAGGVKEEFLCKVFEPYFSTKRDLNGTGLGLYISKVIIENNLKGKIYLENFEDGLRVTIKI